MASATAGLWRVGVGDRSFVVKVLAHGPGGGSPNWRSGAAESHWYYWRREAEAYASGLLDSLTGGLRPPRCHLVAPRDDGCVALWLEDLRGAPASAWPLERYGAAARHLGRAQGEFVAGRPLPTDRWLSRRWLRSYLRQPDHALAPPPDAAAWGHPTLSRWFPDAVVAAIRALHADQERFLDLLDRLPPTLCHLDLHPANLLDGGGGTTALIDWSFVGTGSIGEDAGNLVPDSVFDFHVAPDDVVELYDTVVAGYDAGLRDAGWSGSAATVRLAMAAAMAAKYTWIAPAMRRAVAEERDQLNGRPTEETVAAWAPTVHFLLDRAQEARDLSPMVGERAT